MYPPDTTRPMLAIGAAVGLWGPVVAWEVGVGGCMAGGGVASWGILAVAVWRPGVPRAWWRSWFIHGSFMVHS